MEEVVRIDSITKAEFERWTEEEITDSQWEAIADEIRGRVENYLDGLLESLLQDYREGEYDE